MSTMSAWSYTALVTMWAPLTRDAYGEVQSWDRRQYACSYLAGGRQGVSDTGEEFSAQISVYLEVPTEADAPQVGWFVLVGDSVAEAPPDGAQKVRQVIVHDDSTFRRERPDVEVLT